MKIMFCNIPMRSDFEPFPPVGITRLIDSLNEAGFQKTEFYNIDLLRPSKDEVVDFFIAKKPDIVGISAVVSTSYSYVKWLTGAIKDKLEDVTIILGGNLAVSYNVILNKCAVDYCVVGEGEVTIVELCNYLVTQKEKKDSHLLNNLQGIAYRKDSNTSDIIFTGYGKQLEAGKVRQPNYELLCSHYLRSSRHRIENANRSELLKTNNGKEACIELSKGCVNRCTFCHRWSKGYRTIPLDNVFKDIKKIIDKYHVDYISFADENFGSNKKHVDEFLNRIKDYNIYWHVAGMRVKSAEPELIKKMKEAGCLGIYFGIESGSNKMLSIMEKNATAEDNLAALKLLAENKMHTVISLVIGMPGEDKETIQETIFFLKRVKESFGNDYLEMSINYAQTLPGTPLYEYAYKKQLIKNTLDGEEEYLLKVSDTDACSFDHFINMTYMDNVEVLICPRLIFREVNGFYIRERSISIKIINKIIFIAEHILGKDTVSYFVMPLLIYRSYKNINHVWELLFRKKRKNIYPDDIKAQSLRKTVKEMSPELPVL